MRKGWALVEVLTVVAVSAMIMIPLTKLTRVTLRDIPRSYRIIQSNTSILDMLRDMREDINSAKDLSIDNGLQIQNTDCSIIYTIKNGKIIKSKLDKLSGKRNEIASWPIGKGKITWKIWQQNNKGSAVEVKTYIEQKNGDLIVRKMANSHVFFTGVYRETIK